MELSEPGQGRALGEFQKNMGLPDDGVAGPQTLAALGLAAGTDTPSLLQRVTVDAVNPNVSVTPAAQY